MLFRVKMAKIKIILLLMTSLTKIGRVGNYQKIFLSILQNSKFNVFETDEKKLWQIFFERVSQTVPLKRLFYIKFENSQETTARVQKAFKT